MTRSERQALLWLVCVIAGGSGVHVYRNWRHSDSISALSTEALNRQLLAVDSAQRVQRQGAAGRSGKTGRRRQGAAAVPRVAQASAVASVPATDLPRPRLVDVDVADSASLEGLPRIGPALAARIVADRARRGPYGSIGALERVRGIGPKMVAALASYVTFSGTPRPSPVQR